MSVTRRWTLRQRALVAPALARRRLRRLKHFGLATVLLTAVVALTLGTLTMGRWYVNDSPPMLRVLDPIQPEAAPQAEVTGPTVAPPAKAIADEAAGPVAWKPNPTISHLKTDHSAGAVSTDGRATPQRQPSTTVATAPTAATATAAPGGSVDSAVWFNGKRVRPVKTIRMRVTGYCPCAKCCGRHADGKTASGYPTWVNRGKLVAADTHLLPFGTLVSVPGYDGGRPVPVLDRGSRIVGYHLDLLFPRHAEALRWGTRYVEVTIWQRVER